MNWVETDLGFIQEIDQHLIFFGKNAADLDKISQVYPDITFRTIHQTHSDVCVLSSSTSQNADAHYTREPNIGLIVKTADCLPILTYDKSRNLILAIHAGWRGIENQITAKSLQQCDFTPSRIFIGPHILQNSFEVDLDVKEKLLKVFAQPNDQIFRHDHHKFCINLSAILENQLPIKPETLSLDTVTDLRFNSYRRDRANAGRNLSFIARLK